MANEVQVLKGATFNYKYQPATIELDDYEGLVEIAETVADHYDKLVFKDADLSEINLAHKELNSFIIGLEDSRKKVKREYQKPLNDFEKKIKNVVNKLSVPLHKIKDERDQILDAQEEARHEALIDYIERRIKDTPVKLDDLTIEDSWTNKGGWTEKLNPRQKLKDEINFRIDQIKEENKKMLAERKVLETFLDNKGMEEAGWIRQLEFRSSTEIIQEILEMEKEEKVKETVEEKEEIIEPVEEEIIEPIKQPDPFVIPEVEYLTEVIEVTATREKLELMAQFMIDNEINYRPYNQ